MKIIHFSDPHSCAAPGDVSAFFDKRILGFFNYLFRRRFQHDLDLLDDAVEYILSEKPDLVICTGDLTSTGQAVEFDKTLEKLAPLIQNKKIPLLYVPGNHDVYVKNARCQKALNAAFSELNNYVSGLDDLPVKLTIEECDFILVNECKATNIFLSCGYVTSESLEKIQTYCQSEKINPRILVGHFPAKKKYSFTESRRGLKNNEKIRELLEAQQIDLSLCGHVHHAYADVDASGRGEICAGSITRFASLAVIEYSKKDDTFSYQFKNIKK